MLKKKVVIFPVQMKVREFKSRLLMAYCAAKSGYVALIGDMQTIYKYYDELPNSLVVEKHLVPGFIDKYIDRANAKKNKVAICDEEGIYIDPDRYFHTRVSEKHLPSIQSVYMWGSQQSNDIELRVKPRFYKKFITTGTPKFDLTKIGLRDCYSDEVAEIKKSFGDFILINSSFSVVNSYLNTDDIAAFYKMRGVIRSDSQLEFAYRRYQHIKDVFPVFLKSVKKLCNDFPAETFIVRPHPTEKPSIWESELDKLKNVHVVHRGDSNAWALASKLVIHNNCTTGLEACSLGKPVISYRPKIDPAIEYDVLSEMGIQAFCYDELLFSIERLLAKDSNMYLNNDSKIARNWISNWDGGLAVSKITQDFNKIDIEEVDVTNLLKNNYFLGDLKDLVLERGKDYYNNKFPRTSGSEVSKILSNFNDYFGGAKVVSGRLYPKLFVLHGV